MSVSPGGITQNRKHLATVLNSSISCRRNPIQECGRQICLNKIKSRVLPAAAVLQQQRNKGVSIMSVQPQNPAPTPVRFNISRLDDKKAQMHGVVFKKQSRLSTCLSVILCFYLPLLSLPVAVFLE